MGMLSGTSDYRSVSALLYKGSFVYERPFWTDAGGVIRLLHRTFAPFADIPLEILLAGVLAMAWCLCLSVCQVGVLSKRIDGSSWFLARMLSLTCPMLCFFRKFITWVTLSFVETKALNFSLRTKSETVVFGLRRKFKTLVSAKDKVTQLYLQTRPSGTLS